MMLKMAPGTLLRRFPLFFSPLLLCSRSLLFGTLGSRSSPLISPAGVPGKAGRWESCMADRICRIYITVKLLTISSGGGSLWC